MKPATGTWARAITSTAPRPPLPAAPRRIRTAIPYHGYTTWNVGIGITKSVFTLDLRYYDTNYSKADCNAFTSDHTARFSGDFSGINPGGFGSSWCSATFVATGKFDLTAIANLK